MKRIILGTSVLLMLLQNAYSRTNKEFDEIIKYVKNPLLKQTLMCEKEVINHKDYGDPLICVESANLYKKQNSLTKKEKKYYGEAYKNAGIMYLYGKGNINYKQAYHMFLKAEEVGYYKYNSDIYHKLGYMNDEGIGTNKDKILAYKYYMKAAKMGNTNSQNNLDIMCRESSWACK